LKLDLFKFSSHTSNCFEANFYPLFPFVAISFAGMVTMSLCHRVTIDKLMMVHGHVRVVLEL